MRRIIHPLPTHKPTASMLRPLWLLFISITATIGVFSSPANTPLQADERPNIIYIMTDDLGYGDVGCFGQEVIQTPNIDQMAAEGLRMTDHYAGHTVCRPSRLVLWTGQHTGSTGLIGNRPKNLSGAEATIPKLLQAAGYATGGVGKWALGNVDTPDDIHNDGHPNNNGFDYWFGYLNQSNAHNYYPTYLWENDQQVPLAGNVLSDHPQSRGRVSVERETYSHDLMTDAALEFVRRNHEHPFLLHVHWTIPHANNEGGRVTGDGMEVPDYGPYADESWPDPEKGFAAMITRMDADVGRLLDLLEELEIDDNTIVFFTSDNGPHQEGNHRVDFFNSNGPLKGYKRSMHEGGIRVPMIVRWPGVIQPGSESDHPTGSWDFLPTACEFAGVDPPPDIDGISIVPAITGRPEDQPRHEYLYWASSEGATSVGVRRDKWKLVRYRENEKSNQGDNASPWRLYDLASDLGEETDIAADHPDIVKEIQDLLKRDGLWNEIN